MCLFQILTDKINGITNNDNGFLKKGNVDFNALIKKIEEIERFDENNADDENIKEQISRLIDEKMWTFLVACGYAAAGENGANKLSKILTRQEQNTEKQKIWVEPQVISPRIQEGQTHLDLAMGTIDIRKKSNRREDTKSGIKLSVPNSNNKKTWICFCEAKFYSDISKIVKHDKSRNQLARVIENALFFNNLDTIEENHILDKNTKLANKIYVTLITPKIFKKNNRTLAKTKLYQYKFKKYKDSICNIKYDIDVCQLTVNFEKESYTQKFEG